MKKQDKFVVKGKIERNPRARKDQSRESTPCYPASSCIVKKSATMKECSLQPAWCPRSGSIVVGRGHLTSTCPLRLGQIRDLSHYESAAGLLIGFRESLDGDAKRLPSPLQLEVHCDGLAQTSRTMVAIKRAPNSHASRRSRCDAYRSSALTGSKDAVRRKQGALGSALISALNTFKCTLGT